MFREMHAPWLVRTSSLYFHKARALRHTSALLRYNARSLRHRYERAQFTIHYIDNGNWTEWSAIWAEIIRVISKSVERAAQVRFEITSMFSDQNCTTRSSITTLLHPFWNRPNTGLGQFKYFIDAILSWFEIKFIHFLRGKVRVLETKVAKFAIRYSLSIIFLQFDWLL